VHPEPSGRLLIPAVRGPARPFLLFSLFYGEQHALSAPAAIGLGHGAPFDLHRQGKMDLWRFLRGIYQRLPPPPSTNFASCAVRPSPYDLLPPDPIIYDIGAKDVRAAYFGTPPQGATIICTDIQPGPGVDIVADAQHMPQIPSESADCVFLVSVLQHIPSPHKAVDEVFRVLRPGGIFYVNVPFLYFYHRDPEDFHRFSVPGLECLCSCFERISSGSQRGPASTFCDLLIRFLAILFSFNSEALYAANVYCGKWALFWIKYLDIFIARYSVAYLMWGSPYFIGRKPPPSRQSFRGK
jgi:SAM-dependent methyltransferase